MSSSLESRLGYSFHDRTLLELALTHASLGHGQKKRVPHNERLEFLGDAVLELVMSEYLYHRYPDVMEGRLTKVRSHLVNRSSLAKMAKALNLGEHLFLGKSEEIQGGRERVSNVANAMEAVIGAIFLDGGYESARKFLIHQIEPRLMEIVDNPEPENAKGILQEKLHARGEHAVYRIISESGPPHQKEFHATVEIGTQILGSGIGTTKKEAETRAATAALIFLADPQNSESGFSGT